MQVPDTRWRGPSPRLRKVSLRRVVSVEDRALWRAMLDRHHPRKQARAPGCRLTYLLESSRIGILGGFSFVAAPMRLGPCDKSLQWSPRASGAHIAEVVDNDRFLLPPRVRVKKSGQSCPDTGAQALAGRLAPAQRHASAAAGNLCRGKAPRQLLQCRRLAQSGPDQRPGAGAPVLAKNVWVFALAGKRKRAHAKPPRELAERLCTEPMPELGRWPDPDRPRPARRRRCRAPGCDPPPASDCRSRVTLRIAFPTDSGNPRARS